MSRFDYVRYDNLAAGHQAQAKMEVSRVEALINALGPSRGSSIALTKLEECYMWIGKAIRDEQIARNGSAEPQESRGNS